MTIDRVAVVGAGRVGLSLARALVPSGRAVAVLARRDMRLAAPLDAATLDWDAAIATASLVMVAVPDDALADVSARLARGGAIGPDHVVLHTSGMQSRSALSALGATGAALGSWHPLQTFARAGGEPDLFGNSPVIIEGDARALAAGRLLAEVLQTGPVVEIPAERKAAYHAGAVFASNYLVVLASVAARLARETGAGDAASLLFQPLMERTLANFAAAGPAALTGPISRGDAGTVAGHLAALNGSDRALYIALGREALRLAAVSGLDAEKATAIERLLY